MTSKNDIKSIGKTIFDYFKKNKTYPKSVKIKGTDYTIQEATYLMASFIATPKDDIPKIQVKGASAPTGDRVNREVTKSTYQDMSKRLVQYIKQNGKLPNFVTIDGKQRCSIILFMLQLSKILNAYDGAFPSRILINSQDLVKEKPKTYMEEIFDYFCKKFGKPTTIDGALEKIQGRGYGFYYNDKLSNKQVIDGLAGNGEKPNCTDVSQMMWWIGKALGYDVRAIHVMCQSGVGHIRLQFRHSKNTDGQWINRDPASVIDGNSVSSIWCQNGTYLATNPQWFMNDLNK